MKGGKFIVHKRSKLKDYCPDYLDACSGGVVNEGETFAENAVRELKEEFGLGVPLTHFDTFFFHDDRTRVFGDLWMGVFDGELKNLKLQVEEVQSVELQSYEEIQANMKKGEHYTPDSLFALEKLMQALKSKKANTSG
eukprot:TRINITY_DN610_c0_g1_i1.p1 TRINITY_DN610_c0_g1~~TRINITY_DN610_c0_g1_i1.p1  ORF type:complete len:138 (-),score=36.01 TRINITY_DN610_c0_g1_i1:190-603(-)